MPIAVLAVLVATTVWASQPSPQFANRVQCLVESHVVERLGLSPDDIIVEVSFVEKRDLVSQPGDDLRVLPSKKALQRGVQYLNCGIFRNGQLALTFNVKTRIRTFENIAVAAQKVGRHETLAADQVTRSRRETTTLQQEFFTDEQTLIGLRATRMFREGEIITASMVESTPLIERGSEVEILFKRGALVIKLPGVARDDGRVGESMQIKCLENSRLYEAEVVDVNTVIVNL